jgi:nucleoside 2-deoxyribosyltransferase
MDTKTKKKIVYVASPYGFAESTWLFMEQELYPAIRKAGCEILDPWRHKAPLPPPMTLGKLNAEDIEKADGVVAVLDGSDVDSGTASEIGYASARGKWIVGYRGDFRKSGDDENVVVNLQVQYFIERNHGKIVTAPIGVPSKGSIKKTMDKLTQTLNDLRGI